MPDLGKSFTECIGNVGREPNLTYSQCVNQFESGGFSQEKAPKAAQITPPTPDPFDRAIGLVKQGGILLKAVSDFNPRDYVDAVTIAHSLTNRDPEREGRLLEATNKGADLKEAAGKLIDRGDMAYAEKAITMNKELELLEYTRPATNGPTSRAPGLIP